jgi:hypothetical protein
VDGQLKCVLKQIWNSTCGVSQVNSVQDARRWHCSDLATKLGVGKGELASNSEVSTDGKAVTIPDNHKPYNTYLNATSPSTLRRGIQHSLCRQPYGRKGFLPACEYRTCLENDDVGVHTTNSRCRTLVHVVTWSTCMIQCAVESWMSSCSFLVLVQSLFSGFRNLINMHLTWFIGQIVGLS